MEMSKIKLFCGFMLTCCDNSVSVIFTRTHQSSWINCHWPVFFPILIQGPTSGFSVLLPPGLLTPFCMGGPAFSLFSVLWYLCPQNTAVVPQLLFSWSQIFLLWPYRLFLHTDSVQLSKHVKHFLTLVLLQVLVHFLNEWRNPIVLPYVILASIPKPYAIIFNLINMYSLLLSQTFGCYISRHCPPFLPTAPQLFPLSSSSKIWVALIPPPTWVRPQLA